MAYDYIEETKRIIEILQKENLNSFADQIQDAMDGASTGTELIMGVCHQLSQIPSGAMSPVTQKRADSIIKELKKMISR